MLRLAADRPTAEHARASGAATAKARLAVAAFLVAASLVRIDEQQHVVQHLAIAGRTSIAVNHWSSDRSSCSEKLR